jgi:hypothetical protein
MMVLAVVLYVYISRRSLKTSYFMIKTFLTLSAALLCAQGAVMAQSQNHSEKYNSMRQAMGNPLTAGKTTATDSRLIAGTTSSKLGGTLKLVDSSHAYYSPGFGYDHVLDEWKYDNSKSWDFDGSNFNESYRITNTFNAKAQVTMGRYEMYDGSNWVDEEFTSYTYDAAGNEATNLDAYYNGSNWDSSRNTFTYNPANQVTLQVSERYNTGSMQWENDIRTTTTYNGSGQVLSYTIENWNGSQWQNSYRTTNTYVAGRLTVSLSETWNSTWENSGQTLYTYNTAGQVTVLENLYWNSTLWTPSRRSTNAYNTTGDVSSITEEMYIPVGAGGYENQRRTLMSYNSYHQETVETEESWNAGTNQFEMQNFDGEMRYYYEEYTNSVKDNKATASSLNVYPNPAKGSLKLRTSFADATAASVLLLDMSGRMVQQLQLPVAKQHNASLDVSALAPGTYILNMNAGGKVSTQKVVVE